MTDNILLACEIYKLKTPTIYEHKIQETLLTEGICNAVSLPGQNTAQGYSSCTCYRMSFLKSCKTARQFSKLYFDIEGVEIVTQ